MDIKELQDILKMIGEDNFDNIAIIQINEDNNTIRIVKVSEIIKKEPTSK